MVKFKFFATLAPLFFSQVLFSHPLDLGLLNISGPTEALHIRLELNPEIGARLLKLTQPELALQIQINKNEELFLATLGPLLLSADETQCKWSEKVTAKIENPQLLAIDTSFSCPSGASRLKLDLHFLKKLESTYRLLVRMQVQGTEHVGGADPENSVLSFKLEKNNFSFFDFIVMGCEHIGVSPGEWVSDGRFQFPLGIDHILFIVALILCGGTFTNFLKTITGFTIGHTTSLALVVTGSVHIPSRWIEALIALSICLVASEAFFNKKIQHRLFLTVVIGIIHGFGFSEALQGLQLNSDTLLKAILGFNLGVEFAQIFIVIVTYPLLALMRRSKFVGLWGIRGFAAIIVCVSFIWFLQRAFGIAS